MSALLPIVRHQLNRPSRLLNFSSGSKGCHVRFDVEPRGTLGGIETFHFEPKSRHAD
jgi:hypothetical protein